MSIFGDEHDHFFFMVLELPKVPIQSMYVLVSVKSPNLFVARCAT